MQDCLNTVDAHWEQDGMPTVNAGNSDVVIVSPIESAL